MENETNSVCFTFIAFSPRNEKKLNTNCVQFVTAKELSIENTLREREGETEVG